VAACSYAGPKGLTCEAEFTRLEPTVGDFPCCNPVGNDCGDGKACLPVQETTDSGEVITTECLPVADSAVAKGKVCKTNSSGQGCVAGTMCTATIGSGKGAASTCKALCVEASQCGKGETCLLLTGTPKAGFCDTACDLFSEPTATGACTDGGTCQPVSAIDGKGQPGVGSVCTAASKLGLGSPCKGLDCGAGLTCSKGTCQPLCDDSHPCPGGKKCATFQPAPLPPIGPSTGVCQ
jgi:hypothetical protein